MENTVERQRKLTFLEFYAKESPIPFYVMLGLFIFTNMLQVVNFTPEALELIEQVRLTINTVLLWLCPMYFAFNLILWHMKPWTIAIGVGMIAVIFALWNLIGAYNELFCTVVAVLLALLAYKRDYRKILIIFLVAHMVTILAGIAGLEIGYAAIKYKLGNKKIGISLGLIYPNHLGRMVYIVLTLAWYLWGQRRHILTMVVFWACAIIMWKWVRCKTIALFLLAFPLCWWMATLLLRIKCRMEKQPLRMGLHKVWNVIMIAMPFIMLAVTYILGRQRVLLDATFPKGSSLHSLFMRFIAAGILFQAHGFPLIGRDIMKLSVPGEYINGRTYMASIVDNAFIYYLIALGGIALIAMLVWLSIANLKAIRCEDHALLLLSVFMLGYGLIEIVLFQFEHNFLWFYPLAAVAMNHEANAAPA